MEDSELTPRDSVSLINQTNRDQGPFWVDVGKRLKDVREARRMSQRDLAARSGMTSGAISLIEQNKTSPSVSSLKRLLDAVPMSISEFFSEIEAAGAPKYFYSADEFVELSPERVGLGDGASRVSLRQVGDAWRHTIQMLHETYPPGSDTGPEMLSHVSEESGVVVSGIIEVTVGDQVRVLNAGDGYVFDSRIPHRFRNIGKTDCVIVSACTPPSF